MAAEWYFQLMGEEVGPLTGTQIRERILAGDIGPDTIIRKGADANWVLAARIPGLFPAPSTIGPATSTGQTSTAFNSGEYEASQDNDSGVLRLPTSLPSSPEPVRVELRYPALATISLFYNFAGVIVIAGAAASAAMIVVDQFMDALMVAGAGLVWGVGLLAIAQGIRLARDVEANTRATRLLLERSREEQHQQG